MTTEPFSDPGCVKTPGGITAPGILGSTVMRRAKKRKNLSSARHYDQIRFRFHTAKTLFLINGWEEFLHGRRRSFSDEDSCRL